jgi:demethylmenaquinone methyltransferase/2-methoxy-6-polyprenyl-1,4-benzoquinol methylase
MKKEAEIIQKMFANIARRYDFLNHFLSFSFDLYWRKKAIREARLSEGGVVLDVCCGTGDLAIALYKDVEATPEGVMFIRRTVPSTRIVGIDFCYEMLRLGRDKIEKKGLPIPVLQGDVLQLPFSDSTFDAVLVAFGIRNVVDRKGGLAEMLRVVKPGGRLVILEFYKPALPLFSFFYLLYFQHILPILGRIFSRDKGAYSYLPNSVMNFYSPEGFRDLMLQVGCQEVQYQRLTGGVVAIHTGIKSKA